MNIDANPYSPPNVDSVPFGRYFRWRLIPVSLIGTLGILTLGFGFYILALVVAEVFTEGITSFVLESPVAIVFYIGPGISWIAGALLLWKKKFVSAILLVLFGLAIPAALQP